MSGFKLQRLGLMMEPEPGNPQEVEGVLNPAAARGPDGKLYLFPRLVAKGNYSRIGIARVRFNEAGDPAGVERLGIALEPEADYERRPGRRRGCEDPRITFVEPLQRYLMTYTAFSSAGPRIALAISEDLFHWKRWGSRPSAGIRASNSTTWMTKTPASSRSPFLIHPGIRNWPFSTGRSFPALVRRKPPATRLPRRGSRSGKHLDFLLPDGLEGREPIASVVSPPSPAGDSRVALGAAQNRRRHSAHPDPARLADRLPRRERNRGRATPDTSLLLGRGDGALKGASAHDPLSFGGAVLTPALPQERAGPLPTSCSPPASTGATILASRIASTSITGWPTIGLAWHALTCRICCRREGSQTRRTPKCNVREMIGDRKSIHRISGTARR